MSKTARAAHIPAQEHGVPWFWPFAAAVEMAEIGIQRRRGFSAAHGKGTLALVDTPFVGPLMGANTLADSWPTIGRWITEADAARST